MTHRDRFKAAALLVIALGVAGCGEMDPETVSKAGFIPASTPDITLTCYDYSGNITLKEKPDSTSFAIQEIRAEYKVGKSTYVTGGSCISEKFSFNVKNEVNASRFDIVRQEAPYSVVITNGVDKILLSDRFTDVISHSDGETRLELKFNGAVLHEVKVMGLPVIATAQHGAIPDYITNAQPQPAQ